MKTWTNTKKHVESLALKAGEAHRGDCPECGRHNTFTVTDTNGEVVWNCYSSNCNCSGTTRAQLTGDTFKHFEKPWEEPPDMNTDDMDMYSEFLPLDRSQKAMDYAGLQGATKAYAAGIADIRFDPKQDRVVFMVYDEIGNIVDAVGRSLCGDTPKWYRYGKSATPFLVDGEQSAKTAVVVEDCFSACAISFLYSGVALLGTNPTKEALTILGKYDVVYICLDKDASGKAMTMANDIANAGAGLVRIKLLEDDLKYMSEIEITALFGIDPQLDLEDYIDGQR